MRRIAGLCFMLIALSLSTAWAQVDVGNSGTIDGTVFGDFYWIPLHHNEDLKGNNGFWFRRIYFTYNHEINESFSGRFRLEMNTEGDFFSNSSMEPVVKDAYLKWTSEEEQHSVYAGISSTPTFDLVEDVWGYRPVEKSPLDLQSFGSSRDFGIKLKGNFGKEEKMGYNFMFGNGNSNRNELNESKKFMLALSYELTDRWIVEGYGDFNGQPNNRNIYTGQAFLAYRGEKLSFGALYAYQFRNKTLIAGDLNQRIGSIFATLEHSEKISSLLRVDHMFDPNPSGEGIDYLPFYDQSESTLVIAGVDLLIGPDIHLVPNIEVIIYGEDINGETPDMDLLPRLTLSYNF